MGSDSFSPWSKRWANVADETLKRSYSHQVFIAAGYEDGYANTAPVGAFPEGASPYGALDMLGNVMEWVWDVNDEKASRPHSPRGGSWFDPPGFGTVYARRMFVEGGKGGSAIGFRCAR